MKFKFFVIVTTVLCFIQVLPFVNINAFTHKIIPQDVKTSTDVTVQKSQIPNSSPPHDTEPLKDTNHETFKETTASKNIDAPKNTKDYSQLLSSINKYITDKTGKFGIHFISLTNNQEFGISENDGFVAASTVKVPINLYLYKKIASKAVDPNEKITYKECDYEEGTGSIQDEDIGNKYTIDELSRRSIEESDNVAINMLLRYLGSDDVNDFKESVLKHPIDRERNILSPKDMSYFMKDILDFKENHPKEGEKLLYYLKNTEFNDRIPKYLPSNVAVAHKIGNQVNVMNDSGIIFADKPFILSVFSKEVNEDEACEVIGRIAKMIYDFEES